MHSGSSSSPNAGLRLRRPSRRPKLPRPHSFLNPARERKSASTALLPNAEMADHPQLLADIGSTLIRSQLHKMCSLPLVILASHHQTPSLESRSKAWESSAVGDPLFLASALNLRRYMATAEPVSCILQRSALPCLRF